ncbi:PBP1A family penicillin-binding protein [Selenomonadales bacterium OttesenSCG-928-I06]|nr:PBP1A family penicillin-binding protein [Selenomonadales bacterium OttesenSCG-928-I06]
MRKLAILLLVIFALNITGCTSLTDDLPDIKNLEKLQLVEATQVFDRKGRLISKLFEENRVVVPISSVAPELKYAIIANEDIRFYNHLGVDPIGIVRAVVVNIRSGGISEGASTITQQLVRNMFLNQDQTFVRKIKEAAIAVLLERRFSKEEILEAYLNQIYFGEGVYGVEAASQLYFNKSAKDLTLAEAALIAGIPKGPNIYSPYVNEEAAFNRRQTVLEGLAKTDYVSKEEIEKAKQEPMIIAERKKRDAKASYFLDYIAGELASRYGEDKVYRGGLKVYTTLDIDVQKAAENILRDRQGAVLSLDVKTGYVLAMVGGRDYNESQINRVFAEVRQPGSLFKPFIYVAALDKGLKANSVIVDEPININGYKPKNHDNKFNGAVILRKALRMSMNVASVKLAQQVGMNSVLDIAKSLGISTITSEDNNLASALGGLTQGVNLYEMATAYTAFANEGIVSEPVSILKVVDRNGQILEQAELSQKAVLSKENAYIITDMLKGVIQNGTGTLANINRDAAGKTGTSDNYETAWFVGYTPDILTGIYVGNDDRTTVGISGSQVAGLWGEMMSEVTKDTVKSEFKIPENIIANVPVYSNSGKYAYRTSGNNSEVEYAAFIKGTEPKPLITPFWEKKDNNANKQTKPKKESKPFWKIF